MHELAYWLGLTSPDSLPYLLWSGIGSDMAKLLIVGSLVKAIRHHLHHHHGGPHEP